MALARCLSFIRYVAPATLCKAILLVFALASPAAADTLRLVAFGDSLTHGFGLAEEDGFTAQLQRWLRAKGQDVDVINMGVSGDTTEGGRARLAWALADGADALILELGGNDMLRGIDPALSRANLDAMLSELGRQGIPVLLAGLEAPLNYGPEFKAEFDAMFPDLAARHGALHYASFIAAIEGPEHMQADGIHPNAEGVALIVADIGPRVIELLDQAKQ